MKVRKCKWCKGRGRVAMPAFYLLGRKLLEGSMVPCGHCYGKGVIKNG